MAYLSTDPYAGSTDTDSRRYLGGSATFDEGGGGYRTPEQMGAVKNPLNQPIPTTPGNLVGANPIVGGNAQAPAMTTAPAGPTIGQTPGDILNFIKQYATEHNIQPAQMPQVTRQIVDALKAKGLNVDYEQPDEYGRSAGIVFNGQHYKIVNGSDQWMFDTYERAEGSPWMSGGSGGYGNMFGNSGMGGPFNPPSWESLKDYPGYESAFSEGLRGIQNSAAAKGTLLTGGTMKEIGNYLGGSLAGNAYQQYFNNSKATHDTNFGDLISMGQLGKP